MSNSKHVYGWSGHTLTRKSDELAEPEMNVLAVSDGVFLRIVEDFDNATLDPRIRIEQLGIIDSDYTWLATGSQFTEGFSCFCAPFIEAEIRAEESDVAWDSDVEYLKAMKEIYGLDLPPCRLMVGCSSEH